MSPKEWADAIVSFVKVTAWPTVILWLLLKYRESISEVIKRISTITAPGVSAQFGQTGGTSPTPTLDEVIRRITSERDNILQAGQQIAKWWWFEKVWNIIYRSQIAILEYLHGNAPGSVRWNDILTRFYLPVVAQIPTLSAYQFPQYMNFLGHIAKFVTWDQTVDRQNPPVTLTDLGREFLTYMASQGYTKEMKVY